MLILQQTKKGLAALGTIVVKVDDVFKLFTRSYMEHDDPDFWLMDKEAAAKAISDELPYGMSIRYQDGLARFQACNTEDPWSDDTTAYCKKWATVKELRELIPPQIVAELEKLNNKTIAV